MSKKICKEVKKKKIKVDKYNFECTRCGLKADKEKKLCKPEKI